MRHYVSLRELLKDFVGRQAYNNSSHIGDIQGRKKKMMQDENFQSIVLVCVALRCVAGNSFVFGTASLFYTAYKSRFVNLYK